MAKDLKQSLRFRLDQIAPEYSLVELTYPSFTRCYGYRSQPLSASDSVEAVAALIDVASGVRMEVEVEGARNGGEWFGGGRVWTANGKEGRRDDEHENVPSGALVNILKSRHKASTNGEDNTDEEDQEDTHWVKNFWTAFDALNEYIYSSMPWEMILTNSQYRPSSGSFIASDVTPPSYHSTGIIHH